MMASAVEFLAAFVVKRGANFVVLSFCRFCTFAWQTMNSEK